MGLVSLDVELDDRRYPILIGNGLIGQPEQWLPHFSDGAVVVVTNDTIAPLYLDTVRSALGGRLRCEIILADGEQHKTLDTVARIYDSLIAHRCDRQTTLLALGGGVVGDMTGFAAATYQRGVHFVQMPTTLLAQVDSSVGGKTGVNHPQGKNMIGAFYQPRCVIADIGTLGTLPDREYAAGIAEVIKYGLIADAPFDRWLTENMARLMTREPKAMIEAVRRSCANKAAVVAEDEREGGRRAILNLGHTFGHAIETATAYTQYLHGEAVAIGMLMAADLSSRLGWIGVAEVTRIRALLQSAGLPVTAPTGFSTAQFMGLMSADKKVLHGQLRLVLLREVGEAIVTAATPTATLEALLDDWLMST
jgi:3-dehydroquinate synthase